MTGRANENAAADATRRGVEFLPRVDYCAAVPWSAGNAPRVKHRLD